MQTTITVFILIFNPLEENSNEKVPEKTLDTLFRKTNTKPNIYYLPLTEEEVKLKINFKILNFRFWRKKEN